MFIIKTQPEINAILNKIQKRSTISSFHFNFVKESLQRA